MPLPNDFDPRNISPHAPIPDPNGDIIGAPVVRTDGDWSQAPQIVKSVRILNILGACLTLFALLFSLVAPIIIGDQISGVTKGRLFFNVVLAAISLPVYVWLIGALKSGARAAWTGQIILSVLGLLNCPCGTLIHTYVLTQWFKPEVKEWFSLY